MLVEKANIKIQAGQGGRGSVSKFANKSDGGDGGNGGNVCIKGSRSMYDLHTFNDHQVYRAENGQPGESLNRKGNNGKDLILIVPLVTEVIMDGKVFGRVSEDGQIIKLLDGTKGNHGNVSIGRHFDLRATNALKETKPVNIQLHRVIQRSQII